jgi:hypothetical protein
MVTLWPEVFFSGGDNPALLDGPGPLPGPGGRPDTDTGSWFDGLDYELRYKHLFPPFGARATVELSATKQLGVLENRLSFRAPLRSPLADTNERLRFSLHQQINPSDRAYGVARSDTAFRRTNPWGGSHTVSARIDYTLAQGSDRMSVFAELGGALRPSRSRNSRPPQEAPFYDQASRLSLTAQKTAPLGPLTGQANLQFGIGADNLVPHKQFLLGGRSLEAQWRNDTYRQGSAAFEHPVSEAHLVGFGPAGPVAYLRSSTGRLGRTGENVVAGRLSLGETPFPDVNALSPLRLSVFSGLGTVWSDGEFFSGFDTEDLKADAGFGVSYDVSAIPHLERWTAQSDFLQGLKIVSKFPVWASDPVFIEDSTDEFDFRWLIGVEL